MATMYIPRAEAIRDFAAVLARVENGEEIVIEGVSTPVALLRLGMEKRGRLLSETLRILEEGASTATLDPSFNKDLEAVIAAHQHESVDLVWD